MTTDRLRHFYFPAESPKTIMESGQWSFSKLWKTIGLSNYLILLLATINANTTHI